MNNTLLIILESDKFTAEEKVLLAKELAKELKEREEQKKEEPVAYETYEQKKEWAESRMSEDDKEKREEQINKNNKAAEENKKRLAQYNLDSRVKELTEIILRVEGRIGSTLYTRSELERQSSFELEAICDMYRKNNPEALDEAIESIRKEKEMEKAREKIAVGNEEKEQDSDQKLEESKEEEDIIPVENGIDIEGQNEADNNISSGKDMTLRGISERLGLTSVSVLPAIAEHKKQKEPGFRRPPRLEENLKKMRRQKPDEHEVVYEEDGSIFTKAKTFFKKQWKKVLIAGAVIGGAALAYHLLKQGQADSAQQVAETIAQTAQTTTDQTNDIINNLPDPSDQIQEFASRTDVGNISETFYTNNDATNGIDALTPNEYHQNEIINAVTSDNEILPADNMGDVLDYASGGKDITSLQVGDANGIDGHVNEIDGKPLGEVISEYQDLNSGGALKQ